MHSWENQTFLKREEDWGWGGGWVEVSSSIFWHSLRILRPACYITAAIWSLVHGPLWNYIFNLHPIYGNEADFLGFLHKQVRHRSITLRFEPFRFWLRIRGDIRNRKTTRRVGESGSCWLAKSESRFSITNISVNSKPKAERLER
jgi:hypothetical protein